MKVNVKMKSMGVKRNHTAEMKKMDSVPSFPSLSLNSKQIDGLEKLSPSGKVILTFEATVKDCGVGLESWGNSKDGYHANFILEKGNLQVKGIERKERTYDRNGSYNTVKAKLMQ